MTQTPFDTIAAVSTPAGEGGVGIVRISGDKALSIIQELFSPHKKGRSVTNRDSFTMSLGYIKDKEKIIDEVLVSIMRKPHTYTREDIVEINCHGGAVAVNEVLRLVLKEGARLADPGEFTKRAFLNGRIDLAQAEAVLDIVKAKTHRSLKTAIEMLKGELSEKINHLSSTLQEILILLEANIDFSEDEDIPHIEYNKIKNQLLKIKDELEQLISSFDTGKIYRDGLLTVIAGKPNVGKSSIMNAFLRFDRAIVTPIPGTTRDIITEQLNIDGVPFILADTAGITETDSVVEIEGVKRSKSYMNLAGLLLLVFDGSEELDERDIDIAKGAQSIPHLTVVNKIDLSQKLDIDDLVKKTRISTPPVYLSAKNGTGLEELEMKMLEHVRSGSGGGDYSLILTNTRHYNILIKATGELEHALKAVQQRKGAELLAFDVRSAMDILGEITGRVSSKDILDDIFSNFCIGK
ncbi:MAG: tRNA uridine-5-carboxymethylaminomethyl(34) synthesis GTPase MnmE [Spirochaetota bacterium]|nr:MAG: tRNA uridine-5-carboxymethylaminomethyl(34) synthesis GTPase MnmE [Spirochaetota bacterium]